MKKIVVLVLFFFSFSEKCLPNDVQVLCGNQKIDCDNGNKDHFEMVIHCPYEEVDTNILPPKIVASAKQYLVARIGSQFYQRLNYYSSQIIDFKRFNEIKKQKGWISKKSDHRVKYAMQFFFTVQDNMRYYLSVVFDKHGKIISKNQLPDISSNKEFNKIISVCEVKKIAEQDSIFRGDLQNVHLEYSAAINAFVWKVEKPHIGGEKPMTIVERFLIINANTGELVNRETVRCTIDI